MTKAEDTLYVYEKALSADIDTLGSVRKGIENERNRAGILLGFLMIITVQSAELVAKLPNLYKAAILIFLSYAFYLLVQCFCSRKISDGINTNATFSADENWSGRKAEYIEIYHKSIRNNIEKQKVMLSELSGHVRSASIIISMIVMVVFLNILFP